MYSRSEKLHYLMGGTGRLSFVIPIYQRNYNWKIKNCEQLYNDLVRFIKEKRQEHFFGSIVYHHNSNNEKYLIIDGQQRITTVSLLLLAMYNLIDSGKIKPEDENLKLQIYEEWLINRFEKGALRIKLKPIKKDREAYEKLFSEESDYDQDSNLTQNYNFFYKKVLEEKR